MQPIASKARILISYSFITILRYSFTILKIEKQSRSTQSFPYPPNLRTYLRMNSSNNGSLIIEISLFRSKQKPLNRIATRLSGQNLLQTFVRSFHPSPVFVVVHNIGANIYIHTHVHHIGCLSDVSKRDAQQCRNP